MKTHLSIFVVAVVVSFLVAGCPQIGITELGLKSGTVELGKFTLAATAEARWERQECALGAGGKKTDPDCEVEPLMYAGRGLIGVWLPDGWRVDQARMGATAQDPGVSLDDVTTQASPAFRGTFPHVPGAWWTFLTPCTELRPGLSQFGFELDIVGPPSAGEVIAGIVLDTERATFSGTDHFTVHQDPIELHVNLAASTLARRDPSQQGAVLDKSRCEEAPQANPAPVPPVTPGPRGCSCQAVGTPGPRASAGLIGQLLGLIFG